MSYERRLVFNERWTPIELGVVIFLHDMGYPEDVIRRRWLRHRNEEAIYDQILKIYPTKRRPPQYVEWDRDKELRVVCAWMEGRSSSKIAASENITRNAVIGKLSRFYLIPRRYADYEKNPHVLAARAKYPQAIFLRR